MASTALGLLLLAACNRPEGVVQVQSAAGTAAAAVPTVFEAMTQVVVPRSTLIWELAGNLYNDEGNIDATKLNAQQWQDLAAAATAMHDAAASLAGPGIKAAPAGVKLQNEGTAGAFGPAEVQAAIDADAPGFKAEVLKLQAVAEEIATASAAHDGTKVDDASGRLNDVCSACHAKFWYPNQPAQ
jgi:cytochrome c556